MLYGCCVCPDRDPHDLGVVYGAPPPVRIGATRLAAIADQAVGFPSVLSLLTCLAVGQQRGL